MKLWQKALTSEWNASGTLLGFGEIQNESTYARAGCFSAAIQERGPENKFKQVANKNIFDQLKKYEWSENVAKTPEKQVQVQQQS